MKFRIALLAALTMMLGDAAMAQNGKTAVTPVLSGTYILQVIHFCQAAIANTPNGVVPTNSGDSNYNFGTVDFDPTAGQATTSGASIEGSPLIVDGIGNPIAPGPFSQTIPYSNTSTTFMIITGHGNVTYKAFYASVDKKRAFPSSWCLAASSRLMTPRLGHVAPAG
jgi:hypothetical protein